MNLVDTSKVDGGRFVDRELSPEFRSGEDAKESWWVHLSAEGTASRNTSYKIWRPMRDSPRGNFTTRQPPPHPSISRYGPATHRHEYSLFDDISRAPSYPYAQGDFPIRRESLIRNNDRQT